jgi:hypothetical protein
LLLGIIISTLIANSIIILSDPHKKHSTALWILNIVAITASGLGIVAICRYGIHGVHGKSYLYLTLGLISWFSADFTLLYSYYALTTEEQEMVSIADAFWFAGYGFLSLHLFTILRSLYRSIQLRVAITVAIFCLVFVGYNVHILLSSEGFLVNSDTASLVVTLAYPVLDLTLVFPSALILLSLRKDYQQSIPWFLSSLSLLINAIADDGYVNDFVMRNLENLWVWDLFYVTDFIIMAGALVWYNIFHISHEVKRSRLELK